MTETESTTTTIIRRNLKTPVVDIPAQPSTPAVEIHAAKILAAMQRHNDTNWLAAREIRGSRVRSTWATRDTVLAALDHLIACGLVEEGKNVDRFNTTRMRYKLTEAGRRAYIHPTRTAKTRKRANVAFDEAMALAASLCPPGFVVCLALASAVAAADESTLPRPTEPSPF